MTEEQMAAFRHAVAERNTAIDRWTGSVGNYRRAVRRVQLAFGIDFDNDPHTCRQTSNPAWKRLNDAIIGWSDRIAGRAEHQLKAAGDALGKDGGDGRH